MSREVADIARRAAEIIQERGICKGHLTDASGRVCMWGALEAAEIETAKASRYGWRFHAYPELRAALGEIFPNPGDFVYPGAAELNDLPDTDETDIAKFLLGVADRLELS